MAATTDVCGGHEILVSIMVEQSQLHFNPLAIDPWEIYVRCGTDSSTQGQNGHHCLQHFQMNFHE